MSREATKRLLTLRDDGLLTDRAIVTACLNYMSEADVEEMCHAEGFFEDEDEDEDDDEDDDTDGGA